MIATPVVAQPVPEKKPVAPVQSVVEVVQVAAPQLEETKQPEIQSDIKHLKGPRPKGLKKFKPIVEKQPETPVEELSEGQKRKLE